jgi:acryloyl-coenzyme A reductase
MKAVTFHELGGTDVLQYEDVPYPSIKPDEALIRVHAVSINPGPDTFSRTHGFGDPSFALPHVTGSDPAGEVVAIGDAVHNVAVGERVVVYPVMRCGTCDLCLRGVPANYCRNFRIFGVHTWGGRAEYAAVRSDLLVRLPDQVSYEAAATLPVSYITTWHGMLDRARVTQDDTLLVVGAGGGCGVAALQIARYLGVPSIALTGSSEKVERLRGHGAAHVLSYRDADWSEQVRSIAGHGVSVAFDNSGEATWTKTIAALDRGGRMFCSGATTGDRLAVDVRTLYREQITLHFYVQGTKPNLERLVALVGSGDIVPPVEHRLPMSAVREAEHLLASHRQVGKIVLIPDELYADQPIVTAGQSV